MSETKQERYEFSFLGALETLVKYRRFIVANIAIVTILAVIVSLVMPKWYRSTGVILPPESGFDPLITMGAIQRVAATANLPWFATTSDLYGAILASRFLSEKIIDQYDLVNLYDVESLELAVKVFKKHHWINVTDEGLIEMSAEARDPVLAANIVNSALEILDEFNKNTRMTEGKKTLLFVEGRLLETERDLKAAEQTLQEFQEEHGAVELTIQTEALITAAAEIESQIRAIDIRLATLTNFATEDFPEVGNYRIQKRNLEKQLNDLVGETELASSFSVGGNPVLSPSFRRLPDIGIQYVRLLREVELLSKVYAFLAQELERAKILATRDTPTIQLLDRASTPEKKYRPRRTLIVVIAFMASLFGSVVIAFGLDFIGRWREDQENHRRLTRIIRTLREDWGGPR